MPFPEEFLTKIANDKKLRGKKIEVFLAMFGENRPDEERWKIARSIGITETNLTSCLTEIYKKFSIDDSGPVKERELIRELEKEYNESKNSHKPRSEIAINDLEIVDDIDMLVQEVRSCLLPFIISPSSPIGTMRMLSVNEPIPVDKIYIDLNILTQISRESHFSGWPQNSIPSNSREFDRYGLSQVQQEQEDAREVVKKNPKLMVVGKPGSGKTTFLRSLAVECINLEKKDVFDNLVPIFVTLRDFAAEANKTQSWKLADYLVWILVERWKKCDHTSAEKILSEGRALVLLDSLDEVPVNDTEKTINAVQDFAYGSNQLVITCRTQSQRQLDGFIDVEVADFTPQQIDDFVDNWFKVVDSGSQTSLAQELKKQLRVKDNKYIAELTTTPVFLNLICVVFQAEEGNLPKKRFGLYDKAMRKLLERLERRQPIIESLTLAKKEEFLSGLAFNLFQNNNYFPEQRTLEEFIEKHFGVDRFAARKLLETIETETGLLIERSVGYWSFSHLTFQEYFAAKAMIKHPDFPNQRNRESSIVQYVTKENWREVFHIMSEALEKADSLLLSIKDFTDSLLANDSDLQNILIWLDNKSKSIESSHETNSIRALYLARTLTDVHDVLSFATGQFSEFRSLAWALSPKISDSEENDLVIDRIIYYLLEQNTVSDTLQRIINRIEMVIESEIDNKFRSNLLNILNILRFRGKDYRVLKTLHNFAIEYRNIGHRWILTDIQKDLLFQYYKANDILIYCLMSQCNTDINTYKEIKETLLLPVVEISKY